MKNKLLIQSAITAITLSSLLASTGAATEAPYASPGVGPGVAERHYIPVVFHVYGTDYNCDDASARCLTEDKITDALKKLNEDFQGLTEEETAIDPDLLAIRENLNIEFVLAPKDPDGALLEEAGINRYDREEYGYAGTSSNEYDDEMLVRRRADSWDNYRYMNVYVMGSIKNDGENWKTGNTTYPLITESDNGDARVVYGAEWIGDNTDENQRSILTHEFGHWLNLKHTFQENGRSSADKYCSFENVTFCSFTGDRVCDTPQASSSEMYGNALTSSDGLKSNALNCMGEKTNTENFMAYSDNYAMFTQGQVARMTAALQGPTRAPLWSNDNLASVGLEAYVSDDAPVLGPDPKWNGITGFGAPQGTLLHQFTDLMGSDGNLDIYPVTLPSNTAAVAFYLDGHGEGDDPDFYISKGQAPQQTGTNLWNMDFDFTSWEKPGRPEAVGVFAPSDTEEYFVAVQAYKDYANATLSVIALDDLDACNGDDCRRVYLEDQDIPNSADVIEANLSITIPSHAIRTVIAIPYGFTAGASGYADPGLRVTSNNGPVSGGEFDCKSSSRGDGPEVCAFDHGGVFNIMIRPRYYTSDSPDHYENAKLQVFYETLETIADNTAPTADAGGPYTAITDIALTFDASNSIDTDGTIVSYSWDFGDNSTLVSGASPSHTFTSEGTYEVILTVTDDGGLTATATVSVAVAAALTTEPDTDRESDSGGGSFGFFSLLALLGIAARKRSK